MLKILSHNSKTTFLYLDIIRVIDYQYTILKTFVEYFFRSSDDIERLSIKFPIAVTGGNLCSHKGKRS
jgi:hypothetical protein